MQVRGKFILLFLAAGALILAAVWLAIPTGQASAQCGSQASSCKNCHEVQAKDPVNSDGTGWHQSHAFGDFCYICHAGNNQSLAEAEAHAGMVAPLSDVKAACQQCHPADLTERAQVYATALGVEVGTGSAPTSGGSTTSDSNADTSSETSSAPSVSEIVVADSAVIDYNLRYEGKTPVNTGNIVVELLIAAVALGGGSFVYYNERKLRGLPLLPKTSKEMRSTPAASELPDVPGYPSEVIALLPLIARLNPVGLHALQRVLENPEAASEMLHSLSRLDPELVRRLRTLDHDSRALLLALSGD